MNTCYPRPRPGSQLNHAANALRVRKDGLNAMKAVNARFVRRIKKELQQLCEEAPSGVAVDLDSVDDIRRWTIKITGADETLYAGETFLLQLNFLDGYPMEAPEGTLPVLGPCFGRLKSSLSSNTQFAAFFLPPAVPVHPHIYSNGHICLSILYDAWSPALQASAICLSILSMLSSCTSKTRPEGNDAYVLRVGTRSPKFTNWVFEDDTV